MITGDATSTRVTLTPLAERPQVLTLGGLRPGSIVCVVPGDGQTWWKPCFIRAEGSADTHVWYLAPTSDGSIHCWECRRKVPRVVVGRSAAIAEIRKALEVGDRALVDELVRALSWTTAPQVVSAPVVPPPPPPAPVGNLSTAEDVLALEHRKTAALDVGSFDYPAVMFSRTFAPRDHADWDEFYRERAAIFEYLGGHPRQVAEAKASEIAGPPPRYAAAGPLFAGARLMPENTRSRQ